MRKTVQMYNVITGNPGFNRIFHSNNAVHVAQKKGSAWAEPFTIRYNHDYSRKPIVKLRTRFLFLSFAELFDPDCNLASPHP